jgi:hypothetical protein
MKTIANTIATTTGLSRRSLLLTAAALPTFVAPLAASTQAAEPGVPATPYGLEISGDFPFDKKYIEIDGSNMA